MKPEPLKDKETCLNCLNTPCNCGLNNSAFTSVQVKSAVEWLKGEVDVLITMNVKTWEKGGMTIYGHRLHEFKDMIDKAFEDVTNTEEDNARD